MIELSGDRRWALRLCGAAVAATAAGCGTLPRSGPLAIGLDPADEDGVPEGLVVPLTPAVAAAVNRPPARAFPSAFRQVREVDPDALGVDDELELLIWEPGGVTLFGGPSTEQRSNVSSIRAVRVDARGMIFVPFLGEVRAAGLTAPQLRLRLREGLARLADAPEVDVRVLAARSRVITVQGAVGRPGSYMLDRGFTRLTPVLAMAGGSPLPPEQVEVVLRRGGVLGAEMLEDIYADPSLDVPLAPGDAIVLNPIRERFVILGASTTQAEITFPTRRLSLLSALGAAAGLRDFDADPQGVFVLRFEDPDTAAALLPGPPPGLLQGPGRPVIYRLDLTGPEGVFAAQQFLMRDRDAIVASNAPITELRKVLQLFSTVLTPVQQTTVLTQ